MPVSENLPERDFLGKIPPTDAHKNERRSAREALRILLKFLRFDPEKMNFYCLSDGRWVTDGGEISISHTKSAVCVAFSDLRIGVDIEEAEREISPLLKKRLGLEHSSDREAVFLWTKKEAYYKATGKFSLSPCGEEKYAFSRSEWLEGKEYALSVAAEEGVEIKRFFIDRQGNIGRSPTLP